MTALTRSPENTNLLQPTKYLLTIDRIPSTQYFCQAANIPGVSLGQINHTTPFVDMPLMGNKLQYNPFNIRFLVDEQLTSWSQLYTWFRSIASPVSFEERNSLTRLQKNLSQTLPNYSDLTLTVLSALNNPILRIQFINAFPTSLSDIAFDTTLSSEDVMTSTASFSYEYFNILS